MIKLRLLQPLMVNGVQHEAGAEIEADGALADELLRRCNCIPADESSMAAWRNLQPAARNWTRDWNQH
jgi:hypothetical protein